MNVMWTKAVVNNREDLTYDSFFNIIISLRDQGNNVTNINYSNLFFYHNNTTEQNQGS